MCDRFYMPNYICEQLLEVGIKLTQTDGSNNAFEERSIPASNVSRFLKPRCITEVGLVAAWRTNCIFRACLRGTTRTLKNENFALTCSKAQDTYRAEEVYLAHLTPRGTSTKFK